MDLVGPIHPPSSRGNKCILTVIDMLTGFTIAVPIPNKNSTGVHNSVGNSGRRCGFALICFFQKSPRFSPSVNVGGIGSQIHIHQ